MLCHSLEKGNPLLSKHQHRSKTDTVSKQIDSAWSEIGRILEIELFLIRFLLFYMR